jgi:hypothetical protein
LESSALVSSPAALLNFVDAFGPYVLGCALARANVRDYVEASSRASGEDPWSALHRILVQEDVRVLSYVSWSMARTEELSSGGALIPQPNNLGGIE